MQRPEADLLTEQASAALGAGQVQAAQRLLRQALQADPAHLMARCMTAEAALFQKDHAGALGVTDQVLAAEPSCAPAWGLRARALWLAGRQDEAADSAARAADIQPGNIAARLLAAQFLAWTGHHAACRDRLAPLLDAAGPQAVQAAALAVAGDCAITEGRFQDADRLLARALGLAPNHVAARLQYGMNLLRLGRYKEGWAEYAIRDHIPAFGIFAPETPPGASWQGEDLTGRTLLVTDDQGHGDAIQALRFVPLLRARGTAGITWRTFPALVRLFAGSAPDVAVVDALPAGAGFDLHCTSSSLPRLLGVTVATIPAPARYLSAPETLPGAPARSAGRRQVGFAWSGDARHARDHLRSIPAAAFLALAEQPGMDAHSLQHEVRAEDRAALAAHPALNRAIEAAADFADTAALVEGLDLVVTVDTAVAHLAAALGKTVWLVLHVAPDWRWMAEREDSPWYGSVRLFRVRPGEWDAASGRGWAPVLGRLAAALREWGAA